MRWAGVCHWLCGGDVLTEGTEDAEEGGEERRLEEHEGSRRGFYGVGPR